MQKECILRLSGLYKIYLLLVQRSALSAARRLSMRSVQQSILFIRKKNKCESLDVTSVEAFF